MKRFLKWIASKISTAAKFVMKGISSPTSLVVRINAGRAAGLAGFVLSVSLFFKAKFKSVWQITVGAISPTLVGLIAGTMNDLAKNKYFKNKMGQLNTDQKKIKAVNNELVKLSSPRPSVTSYSETLQTLTLNNKYKRKEEYQLKVLSKEELKDEDMESEQLFELVLKCIDSESIAAFERSIENPSLKELTFRYFNIFLDALINTGAGFSLLTVQFILAVVLNEKFTEDDPIYANLRLTAIVTAIPMALYCFAASLLTSKFQWGILDNKRNEVKQATDDTFTAYNNLFKHDKTLQKDTIQQFIAHFKVPQLTDSDDKSPADELQIDVKVPQLDENQNETIHPE